MKQKYNQNAFKYTSD